MPTLQQLQATNSRGDLRSTRTLNNVSDDFIVTDQRSAMSPAQYIEEKLLRLLRREETVTGTISSRRPR